MLSDIQDVPYITFMIKGIINSGKSTLFNAISSKNISKTSMKRQTMCNVILTEDPDYGDEKKLKELIESVNKRVYEHSEKSEAIIKEIEEINWKIKPIENFIKRLPNIRYRFVETVGFDDPKTDSANTKWFKENTKWADVLLFVTDKEKCMNTKSEQDLFRDTVKDIKDCLTLGKSVYLIVVINKVEDKEDDEVIAMIEQCRNNVARIITESNASNIKYSVSVISAMNCLYYRLFMRNYSFDDMEPKDITKLADIELGRRGRALINNLTDLAATIKRNLQIDNSQSKWLDDCGVKEMIDIINQKALSPDNMNQIFMWQYQTVTNEFEKLLGSSNLTWESVFSIMVDYIQYHKISQVKIATKQTYLSRIVSKFIMINGINDLKYILNNLKEISKLDYASVKMMTLDEWNEFIFQNILIGTRLLWFGNTTNPTNMFINYKNKTNHHIQYYTKRIDMTFDILLYESIFKFDLSKFLSDIIIPIIIELRQSQEKLFYEVLQLLDDKCYSTIKSDISLFQFYNIRELSIELIISKIHYRHYIPGYGLLLKELSYCNKNFREKCYFAIVPVLYEVSDIDKEWALNIRNQPKDTKKSYQEVFKSYQHNKCEKFLL